MALQTPPTFTPSGYAQFAARGSATAIAIPAGSTPDKVLLTNLGGSGEAAIVALSTAAATTTATGLISSFTLTVASATSIAVGQGVVAAGVQVGTVVSAISGTTVTLSLPTTLALSATAINFVTPVTLSTGIAVAANSPIYLAIGSNTFISAISMGNRSILNVAVGV